MSTYSTPAKGTTRSSAIPHIFEVVLGQPEDSVLHRAFEACGYTTLQEVMEMSSEDIDNLCYMELLTPTKSVPKPTGHSTYLPKPVGNLLRILQAYVCERWTAPADRPAWSTFDPLDYANFRVTWKPPDPLLNNNNPPSPTSPYAPRAANYTQVDDLRNFQRNVKRDKTHYPELRETKGYDPWIRSTKATGASHNCEDVFDPSYKPKGPEAIALFHEKQKFICSAFVDTLKTDLGKLLVREHESTSDAQEIFRKLLIDAKTSTRAVLDADAVLAYLTTTKLHNCEWKGSTCAFIIHWCDQLRQYDDQTPLALFTQDV